MRIDEAPRLVARIGCPEMQDIVVWTVELRRWIGHEVSLDVTAL